MRPGGKAGKLMTTDRSGRAIIGQLADKIEAEIIAHKIDLVMVDPFVKSHSIEENQQLHYRRSSAGACRLGTKHDVAVDAPHHYQKGRPIRATPAAGAVPVP